MANLTTIPDHYTIQFETNFQILLQQMDSRLKEKVKLVQANGAAVRFNQFGTTSMTDVTAKNSATPNVDITMPARWAYPTPKETSSIFSEFDSTFLGSVVLPTSETMQAQVAAYNRAADATIIAALTGTATRTVPNSTNVFTANNATESVAYDTTNQQVAVNYVASGTAANSGLTIAKLRAAKRKLDAAEAPIEDRILIVSAKEISDLLGTTEVTSNLYNSVQALVDGSVEHFLGFKVVRSELLPLASGVRNCVAYVKNAAILVDGGKRSYMDVRPDISHALQIRSTAVLGGVRLLDNGVVSILCDNTVG